MFDFNSTFVFIGIVIVIFIICITLFLFAPKSINFYDSSTYPIIKYINENNLDIINDTLESIENDKWMEYPDKKYISGNVKIYPLFMFSVISEKRKDKCIELYNLFQNVPDIKTCAFIKIDKNSKLQKTTQWKSLSNTTLRCMFILKSVSSASIEQCAIWVNGEYKKLVSKNIIIFDSSKEHSIYNETDYPVYILMIDIKRPDKIPNGVSDRDYTDEIYDFINELTALNTFKCE